MGFLDRLLGRGKEDTEEAKDMGEGVVERGKEDAGEVKEHAEDIPQDVRSEISERRGSDQP